MDNENGITLAPYLIIIFLAVILLVLEGSFFALVFLRGIKPDLLLIVIVCLSFLWGEKKGMILGIITGLLQDIFFGPAIGFFALAKMLSAYFSGLISREIYKDQIIGPMLAVFFATIMHESILYMLVSLYWGAEMGFFVAVESIFLFRAFYHFALTLFLYPIIYKADRANFFNPSYR